MDNVKSGTEICGNCGRSIGRLETPRIHGEHVVCAECYVRLVPQAQVVAYATPVQPTGVMNPRVQTVEATGKLWKACQALGVLAIIVGVVVLIAGAQTKDNEGMVAIGALLFILGFIGYVIGRACAWWFHG